LRHLPADLEEIHAERLDLSQHGVQSRPVRHEHIEASPEFTDSKRTAVLGATATTLILRLRMTVASGRSRW